MKEIVRINEGHEISFLAGSRYFHRLLAIIAAAVVPVALVVALIFQATIWQGVDRLPVPPEYKPGPIGLSMDELDAYLRGPTDIELRPVNPVLATVPTVGDRIAAFSAKSPNGLADYPNDFDIIGGRDALLFERTQLGRFNPRAALAPTGKFLAEATKLLASGRRQSKSYQLRVIARDARGIISEPQDISFAVEFAPNMAENSRLVEQGEPEAEQTPSPLQQLARQIALAVDPDRTPRYFSVYTRAQAIPGECGAGNETDFVVAYRAAFAHVQPRLTPENLSAFFSGVCGAWEAAQNDAREAQAVAEARRLSVINENYQRANQEAEKRLKAESRRDRSLLYAAIALLSVVLISLPLSLLAMEKHSRTLRELVETMSRGKAHERTAGENG